MKKALLIVPALMLLTLCAIILPRHPRFTWCKEYASISFFKPDHFEAWQIRFCDGQTWINGKLQPIVFDTNCPEGFRAGYYRWPHFDHHHMNWMNWTTNDIRPITFTNSITISNSVWTTGWTTGWTITNNWTTNAFTFTNFLAISNSEVVFMEITNRPYLQWQGWGYSASVIRVTDEEWRTLTNHYPDRIRTNKITFCEP